MARIAIIGTGAMGSIYAGLMASAGHEVWAVDVWQAHVDAIATAGLRVEGASGDRLVRGIHAVGDAAAIGPCDLIVIATKADGVAAAAESIRPAIGPDTIVMTIQNGLGSGDRIRRCLPDVPVVLGVAQGFGASMRAPGHVHHHGMSLIRIGELDGGLTPRLDRVEAIWRSSGFETRAFDDIHQLIWEKFVCNVTCSAPCTVFNRTVGQMLADAQAWRLCLACAGEAFAAGRAKGVHFSFDDPVPYVTEFARKLGEARPSMLLDHLASRRSEIDAINGMVPVVAAEVGLAAPYNDALSVIVRAREREFPAR
jgi:2-dehydropantoate 2-reductase